MSQQLQQLQQLQRSKTTESLQCLEEHEIDLAIIEERNEELRKIAQDMEDLSDINLSLSELVYEQGEELDIAEYVRADIDKSLYGFDTKKHADGVKLHKANDHEGLVGRL